MNWKKNQSLWTSVILHVVVLVALFLATIIEAFKPKEKEHVFVMVDPPSPTTHSSQVSQPQPIPEPDLNIPDMPDLQAVPDLPKPQPVVQQPPAPQPMPQKPKPAPVQQSKPKTLSYEDFIRQQGQPQPRVRSQPQPSQPQPNVKIDPSRIQRELQEMLRNQPNTRAESQMSAQAQSALIQYNQRLSAALNRAWLKPDGLSGVSLMVQVIFDVSPSGRISNIRLNPGSGNSTFDQSVIAAFQRVGSAGPTPTGQSHTFTKAFRMVE